MSDESNDDVRLDVRAVLEEIGAEEAVARLDAKVDGIEQDVERQQERLREFERARSGELDVMRARVEDAMALVRETMEEQREAWSQFESRFSDMVAESEENSRGHLDELRDELTPRVQRALMHADEVGAKLRGELANLASTTSRSLEAMRERLTGTRAELDAELAGVRDRIVEEGTRRDEAEAQLEGRLAERLSGVEEVYAERTGELSDRLDGLRRELDAAAGELRATVNLKASETKAEVGELRDEMLEAVDDQVTASRELEQRWIEGTRDLVRRIERVDAEVRELLQRERGDRQASDDELARRLDDVAGVLEELHGRVGAEGARRDGDIETLRRQDDEIGARLSNLQSKVGTAVNQIASELSNRVASVSGDLEAARETIVRHEEALSGLGEIRDQLNEHADGLETVRSAQQEDDARVRLDAVEQSLAQVTDEVRASESRHEAGRGELEQLAAAIDQLQTAMQAQSGLRAEVRELASKVAEIGTRSQEAERLARAAGQAIASAVRRSRVTGKPRAEVVAPDESAVAQLAPHERPVVYPTSPEDAPEAGPEQGDSGRT